LTNESPRISEKTLRELQNHSAQRRHSRYLQQQTPQAAAGMIERQMKHGLNTDGNALGRLLETSAASGKMNLCFIRVQSVAENN